MKLRFQSDFQVRNKFTRTFDEQVVKNEPMLFSCDAATAYLLGGPITREFLAHIEYAFPQSKYLIDSRVHMLMPGWYPCIPGWHLDDIPRTRPDGQPDHRHPAYKSWNLMAIVGDASVTEFIKGDLELEDVGYGQGAVYGHWNAEINKRLAQKDCTISVRRVPESTVVQFNFGAFHRGVPATKNGWRFFIRANFNTARKAANEIRKQTQVYMPVPEAGW